MSGFRILLIALFAVLLTYTGIVIANHGLGLFQVFFGDMAAMAWPGQFNLDFMMMLTLSALWVAWRHQFSGGGLALAVLAFLGGASFLTVYVFIMSLKTHGDMRVLLLGEARARA